MQRAAVRTRVPPAIEAVARAVTRQAAIELFGTPGYGLTLAFPKPTGLAAAPRDLRPTDPAVARMIQAGRFVLVGAALEVGRGGDPWRTPSPSRPFAVALHRFDWLPSLAVAGERGAIEALRLVIEWHHVFRDWSPFVWGRETLARRVFNLACASRRLVSVGDADTAGHLADSLARQARHLLRLPDDRGWAAGHTAAAAVAGAALAGPAGEAVLKRALPRLSRALKRTVLPDGCHASRNPEATLELLYDLLTLDDVLTQRGLPPGDDLTRVIDRLSQAVRFFVLSDGRLCAFQGGETRDRAWPAAALSGGDEVAAPEHLPDAAYHRLAGKRLTLVVDAGAPARGPFGVTACSQPLAFEASDGRDRLIVNAGWSSRETDLQGFRLEAAASTASLAEASVLSPCQGARARSLGARLEGPDFRVSAARSDQPGETLVEISHDGWTGRFGLVHGRRLHLDRTTDVLRGEDRFEPAGPARAPAAPFAIRFHLDPDVQVSRARDGKSVLLRGRSERGWWLRHDAGEAHVEPSTVFQDGAPRRTQQIVLRGVARTDVETRVRWKLSPADATQT